MKENKETGIQVVDKNTTSWEVKLKLLNNKGYWNWTAGIPLTGKTTIVMQKKIYRMLISQYWFSYT